MLQDSDLHTFLELFHHVSTDQSPVSGTHPTQALRPDHAIDHPLQRGEFTPLWNSLKIVCAAGDAPETVFYVFDKIVKSLDEKQRYVDFESSHAWESAIRWAHVEVASSGPEVPLLQEGDRRTQVARACQRLRERGYKIPIGTYGPDLTTNTRRMIVDRICGLVSRIGGHSVARQLCTHMKDQNRIHDGLWMFGSPVSMSPDRNITPALPIGWLFSLAIRYFHVPPSSPDPVTDWPTLVQLVTDFAACMDCQRYSHFDTINLDPHDFIHVLWELLEWREVFSLPQVPPMTLPTLRKAFLSGKWPSASSKLRRDVKRLFYELDRLLGALDDADIIRIPRSHAHRCYPCLWRYARARVGTTNAGYREPLDAYKRNHDRFVFFEIGQDDVLVLPRSLTTSAGCHVIFELIWATMKRTGAEKLVGDTLEKCIALACEKRADKIFEGETYMVGKDRLEIDVAARCEDDVILFESKSKPLTAESRSGNFLSLIEDYTHSYLSLARQLFRHKKNLMRGLVPAIVGGAGLHDVRVMMIAVSPLTYGPASDKFLANSLLRAIMGAQLTPTRPDKQSVKIVEGFVKRIREIESELVDSDRDENSQINIAAYLTDVMWLDLGQLLYILNRSESVNQAVRGWNATYGTGDFWTEVAYSHRQKMST